MQPSKLQRPILAIAALVGGLAAITSCYACATSRAVERSTRQTPRDPQTGIVLGAESVSLGDPAASEACLLLHGFVGSRIDFAGLGQRLADRGFFVRMALAPGHGTSPEDFATKSADDMLAGTRAEYDELTARFDRVHLVGFSMGGALATLLAAEPELGAPEDPKAGRLVLIAPYFGITYRWYYVLPPRIWAAAASPFVRYVHKGDRFVQVNKRESVESMYSYEYVPLHGARVLGELGRRALDEDVLARVKRPVLMLHSEGDEAASPEAARRAYERIGSADKEAFWLPERNNHHLLWDYDGDLAADRIVEFLTAP